LVKSPAKGVHLILACKLEATSDGAESHPGAIYGFGEVTHLQVNVSEENTECTGIENMSLKTGDALAKTDFWAKRVVPSEERRVMSE